MNHPPTLPTRNSRKETKRRSRVGGYLRALAQRVEVDAQELRIMGSKSELLRTLVAASSAKTAGFGVPSSVPKWQNSYVIEIII
jgi:site-specific DNA recombinase